MRIILVLGAGKSSYNLIKYLANKQNELAFKLIVADSGESNLNEKKRMIPDIEIIWGDFSDIELLSSLIEKANLVVSLLPPPMHPVVAKMCLYHKKNFLTASYTSAEIADLNQEVKSNGLTFLMECGLDPGIDHMSAMKLLNDLRDNGAVIKSFMSYCGGLISPESDNNPWGYKITWNPRNVVTAGKGTARYLEGGSVKYIPYHKLFERTMPVSFEGTGEYEAYPNRDSLPYISIYGLENLNTFVRGTIRKKGFCNAWNYLIQLGLTDDSFSFSSTGDLTIAQFVDKFLPGQTPLEDYLNLSGDPEAFEKLKWLGLKSDEKINLKGDVSPADCLQSIIEQKWKLEAGDKDMVLMQHIVGYTQDGASKQAVSSLKVTGENQINTAMSQTVGLPLAIAALLLLQDRIEKKGVIIPVLEEIYNPILKELHINNLIFRDYTDSYPSNNF